jgi:hypothetical protein
VTVLKHKGLDKKIPLKIRRHYGSVFKIYESSCAYSFKEVSLVFWDYSLSIVFEVEINYAVNTK